MFGRHSLLESGREVCDEILEEIEGEALVILEHPDRYPALTVVTASHALHRVQHMRRARSHASLPMLQSA